MAWTKPGPGRPKGSSKGPNGPTKHSSEKAREAKSYTDQIINDPEYRTALRQRAIAGTLPPQIEALLFYFSFGKPTEHIEVRAHELPVSYEGLTDEQLAERAEALAVALREVRDQANTIDGQVVDVNPADPLALPSASSDKAMEH